MPRHFFLNLTPPPQAARPAIEAPSDAHVLQTARLLGRIGTKEPGRSVGPTEVEDLLVVLHAARSHRVAPQLALAQASHVMGTLHLAQRRTTEPIKRETLLHLLKQLRDVVAVQLGPDASASPSARAVAQLGAIAAAAAAPSRLSTVSQGHVASLGNAVLGPVLHTGDEVWAVGAALIGTARRSVQLQVWAYHRRSESARHIMGALAALQRAQAVRRDNNEPIVPITVDIVRGSRSWGQGADNKTGGQDQSTLTASLAQDEAKRTQWHCGVVPFAIDPELMRVRFSERTHKQRGAMHTKMLIIDEDIGLMTSANVKGSHHRASNYNAPFHDFGVVIAGDAVRGAMCDDFRAGQARVRLVGDNRGSCALSLAQIEQDMLRAEAELIVAPLREDQQKVIANKVAAASAAALQWREDRQGHVQLVAVSKAPFEGIYGKAPISPQRQALLAAIDNASQSIEINNTNFNADELIAALKRAMDRGVHLKVMTSEFYNDALYRNTLGINSNREVFAELVRYRTTARCPGGLSLKWHPDRQVDGQPFKSSHTKVMFIDGQVAIFGSANLDAQSWSYSGEFNFATHDPQTVHALRESLFNQFWLQGRLKIEIPGSSERGLDAATTPQTRPGLTDTSSTSSSEGSLPSAAAASMPQVLDGSQWQANLFDVKTLNEQFKSVLAGADLAKKDAFMHMFNADFAPRLRTEEAAIERLVMKHNRMVVSPDTPFVLHIESDVFGAEVDDYASRYRRASSLVSSQTGIRAHLYLPSDEQASDKKRAIIAYEGVTFKTDGIARQMGAPTGLNAAFDKRGIGQRAFEHDQKKLLDWSRTVLARGQPLTITGFSMGGTLAARHLAAHLPEERAQIRLLTYAAPALDPRTAAQLDVPGVTLDARHFRTRHDPVTKAGNQHAPGEVFKLAPRVRFASWFNHTASAMSNRELQGGTIELYRPTRSADGRQWSSVEWGRRMLGPFWLPR